MTPGSYEDPVMEYFAVRNQAGVYDISPLIKYRISGREAEAYLDRLQLRSMAKLKPGRVTYTAWCDQYGRVIDDGTVFRLARNDFRLCCQERMLPWLLDSAIGFDVSVSEETAEIAGLSLQGPVAFAILERLGLAALASMKPFDIRSFELGNVPMLISRTGFTGDLGYEIWVTPESALYLWDRLFEAGRLLGLRPFGNVALNWARVEAGFLMAGADFVSAETALRSDRPRTAIELGFDWMIDFDRASSTGRESLMKERAGKTSRSRLVGLDVDGNIPAEQALLYFKRGYDRWFEAGHVTAAMWSPTLKRNIALATLNRISGIDDFDDLWAEIYVLRELGWHKMMVKVRVCDRPFLKLARRTATPPSRA